MTTKDQQTMPTNPEMTVHGAEGLDMQGLGTIVATCYDKGGWVQAVLFTGNKVQTTMDPRVAVSHGVYSAIWLLPKVGNNGKSLKIAEPEDEAATAKE